MAPRTVDMADRTKKRKRTVEDGTKPSKKTAIESSHGAVKVSVHQAEKWAPVVASTPGLAVPNSISFKPYTKARKNAPQRSGPSGAITTTELLLQSSAHPSLDYTAQEEGEGGNDALVKHYVGVYDPETGKVEVMEARKMVVRGVARAQQAATEGEISTNIRDLRNTLGETFGTKKARKAIASVTENAIAPAKSARLLANGGKPIKLDATSSATLAAMKDATAGMSTQLELAEAAEASKPRPKANLNATDIKDVYTPESLLDGDILGLVPVRDWQEAAKSKEEVRFSSQYVARRMQRLAEMGSDGTVKLRLLRYLLCLLDFYGAGKPDRFGNGKRVPPRSDLMKAMGNVPEPIVENIRRRFSTGSTMTKYQGDLLITHVCALACLIDNFEVDTWELKEDLKLENAQLAQYFMEIGARINPPNEAQRKSLGLDRATANQRKFAKLKLPLAFPKVKYARAGR
ncbi:hypothetical protein BP5796_08524 [Coleophoma crateriformis]|uniref:RNA polymerase I associated factor, A49-like protein n=1 Tax=Coleophoma crateriformis TaxID=565419 RepID=A0A3D8R7V9_9HELO|nr:hypothetical protein BP5796_08524 [Coleophoma crateriformis]